MLEPRHSRVQRRVELEQQHRVEHERELRFPARPVSHFDYPVYGLGNVTHEVKHFGGEPILDPMV